MTDKDKSKIKIIEDDIDSVDAALEALEAEAVSKVGVKAKATEITLKNFLIGVNVSEDLKVSSEDLDAALSNQAALYAWYSVAASKAHYQYERAKASATFVSAQQSGIIRERLIHSGIKATEKAIENELIMSESFQAAELTANKARQIHSHCRSIAEAMEQRQQMVIQQCKRAEQEMSMTGTYLTREQRVSNALNRDKTKKP
jgi:dGTP triphosphohydrolase